LSEDDKKRYGDEWLKFIEDNKLITKEENSKTFLGKTFYIEELDQVYRLVKYMKSKKEPSWVYDDMRSYINQCDTRRNINFKETFPELTYLMSEGYYG
jgi:hypothetical protein